MTDKTLEILAYAMKTAYKSTKTQSAAVDWVKVKYVQANVDILQAMWAAIDAYVDINVSSKSN